MPIVTVPFVTRRRSSTASEVSGGSVTSSSVLATITVDDVAGDVPAEARLVITDESSEARRWVEWGLESFYFDTVSPSELFIDSADLGHLRVRRLVHGALGRVWRERDQHVAALAADRGMRHR